MVQNLPGRASAGGHDRGQFRATYEPVAIGVRISESSLAVFWKLSELVDSKLAVAVHVELLKNESSYFGRLRSRGCSLARLPGRLGLGR